MGQSSGEFAHIGKSVFIKGDVSGSEDVYLDGQLEGSLELNGNSLTLGPNGRVHANIVAKSVIIGGQLQGNIQATERTELRKTAVVNGDVQTRRIAIEEGAYFKGKLEILADKSTQPAPQGTAVAASRTASAAAAGPDAKK